MLGELTFTHGGRTYHCRNEALFEPRGLGRPSDAMWMVEVDGEAWAAFPATPDDTERDVKRKVLDWDRVRRSRRGFPRS